MYHIMLVNKCGYISWSTNMSMFQVAVRLNIALRLTSANDLYPIHW